MAEDLSGVRLAARVLTVDGAGRGWFFWFLLSHGLLVAGVLGAFSADSAAYWLTVLAGIVAGGLGTVWFWRTWLRVWRREAARR